METTGNTRAALVNRLLETRERLIGAILTGNNVVNIAASLDMTTVAEGVETLQQKELLRALGCTQMQGFLFSAARPSAEIRKLLVPSSDEVSAVA